MYIYVFSKILSKIFLNVFTIALRQSNLFIRIGHLNLVVDPPKANFFQIQLSKHDTLRVQGDNPTNFKRNCGNIWQGKLYSRVFRAHIYNKLIDQYLKKLYEFFCTFIKVRTLMFLLIHYVFQLYMFIQIPLQDFFFCLMNVRLTAFKF